MSNETKIPAGFVLVPVEPTEAMMRAAVVYANGNAVYKNVVADVLKIEESIYGEVYAAMLAAAPAASVAPATASVAGLRTGWPAEGSLMQDDSSELSKALSRDPNARQLAREAAAAVHAEPAEVLRQALERIIDRASYKSGATVSDAVCEIAHAALAATQPQATEREAKIDEALDIVLLPPIRVSTTTHGLLKQFAYLKGVIIQALVRDILDKSMSAGGATIAEGKTLTWMRDAHKWRALTEAALDEYLEDYETRGEDEDGCDACHVPSEAEKFVIKDAIMGFLADAEMQVTHTEREGGVA